MSTDMVSVIAAALEAHCTVNYALDGDGENNNFILCDQCGHEEMNPSAAEDEWMTAHQARAVLAAISEAGAVEWGVRVGPMPADPRKSKHSALNQIRAYGYGALVSRVVTDWASAE